MSFSTANSMVFWSAMSILRTAGYTIGSREGARRLCQECTDERIRRQMRIVIDLWDKRGLPQV